MCWADRLGVAWVCLMLIILVLALAAGGQSAPGAPSSGVGIFVAFLGPWILVRLLDLVLGGPMRRGRQRYFEKHPQMREIYRLHRGY